MVGGGLAGLSCAVRLHQSGVSALVVESSDAIGGRVRTDEKDGFLLDRGFQVYLSAYPEAGRLLDSGALDLRRFKPGALVFKDGRFHRLMDVFRRPLDALGTALQPIGSMRDKLLVGWLRMQAVRSSLETIAAREDVTTEAYLKAFGFSDGMIDSFFRPFYGGIFLERELRTSSRMFEFTFKMFAEGHATVPARGMGEIPRQLGARLPAEAIRLNAPVRSVEASAVTLESGEKLVADAVIVATDAETAGRLVPGLQRSEAGWRSVVGMEFAAPSSPLKEPIIALNGNSGGLVNNVCVLSDVSPHYAPEGKALISVSLLGLPAAENLEDAVRRELRPWFGEQVSAWEHLRTIRIRKSLPEQPPDGAPANTAGFYSHDGIYVCGDHCTSASIEGAVVSGTNVAGAILNDRIP